MKMSEYGGLLAHFCFYGKGKKITKFAGNQEIY